MQSLFGRAAALFTSAKGDPLPEADSCFDRMVARQKAIKAAGVISRLSGNEPEEATVPLYDSSVYNSLGSPEEPWDQ